MSNQEKVVIVNFGKDERLKLSSPDPETLLETITGEETGWVRYGAVAFRREHVTFAMITEPAQRKTRSSKPYGL